MSFVIREAKPTDIADIHKYIHALAEYEKAPEVTRKRLYLETMEKVLGGTDIILLDDNAGGDQGVEERGVDAVVVGDEDPHGGDPRRSGRGRQRA